MRAPIRFVAAILSPFLLLGCSLTEKENPAPCPRISILSDASKLIRFRPGQGRDVTDVELQAEIISFKGACAYDMDKRQMKLTMQIGIDALRGPAAKSKSYDIGYFIAMPLFFPKTEAKQIMPVALAFPDETNHVRYTDEEVSVTFPISDFKKLDGYQVILGFQLDPAQLDYNRANKRGI